MVQVEIRSLFVSAHSSRASYQDQFLRNTNRKSYCHRIRIGFMLSTCVNLLRFHVTSQLASMYVLFAILDIYGTRYGSKFDRMY
jgi:hypothetical protein